MLFPLPLGSGMEELVQHQPRDSFPDYKKGKPCLLRLWFGEQQLPLIRGLDSVPSYTFYPTYVLSFGIAFYHTGGTSC